MGLYTFDWVFFFWQRIILSLQLSKWLAQVSFRIYRSLWWSSTAKNHVIRVLQCMSEALLTCRCVKYHNEWVLTSKVGRVHNNWQKCFTCWDTHKWYEQRLLHHNSFCVSVVFHLKGAVSLAKEQEMRHNIERYQNYLRGLLRKHCDRTV